MKAKKRTQLLSANVNPAAQFKAIARPKMLLTCAKQHTLMIMVTPWMKPRNIMVRLAELSGRGIKNTCTLYSLNTPKKELIRKDKKTGESKLVTIKEQIEEKKDKSELANYVWSLKEQGKKFSLEWSIVKKAFNYKNGQRFCDLCATETTLIALGDPASSLNKRSEIFHKCRYKARFKLQAFLNRPP